MIKVAFASGFFSWLNIFKATVVRSVVNVNFFEMDFIFIQKIQKRNNNKKYNHDQYV